ncbi:hypothetical protein HPB52_000972 [Rhipicephalus sanguineus]|uniref:THAP-type domain-containing protein n=1 Tax=Rhipicephalus sanguineus TaxID=34632 RepID=A0A9D4QFZ3_RHISA|nr:hypothetical protein HPB52_000972 [Rhipicephalus sanguineus]
MPNRCCVPGCRSDYKGSKKTSSSARNGSGPYRCKKAVIINFLSKYTRVCANHFDASDIITAYDFNINGDSVSQKRDKPTLKADTVPRIFEGLPSYLTKRKPRSRSSTVRPPCKRPRESACEEVRASPTPCLYRTVVRVVRKRLARKGPTGSVTARRSPAKCCTARPCRLDENKSYRLYARVKANHYYNE